MLGLACLVIGTMVACDKPTEPGLRQAKPKATKFDLVPSDPPDLTPAELSDPSQIIIESGTDSVYVNQAVVMVRFQDDATQAQRQAAVDSIHGVVIGGEPAAGGPDGYYYVSITGDSAGDSVEVATNRMTALSQVRFASPYYYLPGTALSYRRPVDGTNWVSWNLTKTAIGSEHNWAPELMNLPMAWGCSTGDTSVHVGVIDAAFHSVADNTGNVKYFTRHNAITTNAMDPLTWHGDAVTDVLAAVGNNSSGMTGTAWRASVYQNDVGVMDSSGTGYLLDAQGHPKESLALIGKALDNAVVNQGARVVNLSIGQGFPIGHVLTAREDSAVHRNARYLDNRLREFDLKSVPRPLLVVAAGNEEVDATIDAFPLLAQMVADSSRVLVVAASTNSTASSSSIASFSNYGSLPQVAAPGQNVWAIDDASDEELVSGTSFATAAVSGIGALLYAFDPRLTADSVKHLIVLGAQQSGLVVTSGHGNTYPVVDAYASLKLAAKRTGAPLCGNRVWVEGDAVKAQRDTSTIETLVPSGISGSAYLSAYHGGKRFDLDYSREFTWTNGSWSETSYASAPDAEQGGAFWSYNEADHDAKQWVWGEIHRDAGTAGADTVVVTFSDSLGNNTQFVKTFSVTRPGTTCLADSATFAPNNDYLGNVCSNHQRVGMWDDIESLGQSGSNALFPVMAPQANFILVPIVTMRHVVSGGSQYNCDRFALPSGIHDHCTLGSFKDSSVSLVIYRINIADGSSAAWSPIALDASGSTTRDRGYYEWLEVSEPGDQVVIGAGEHIRSGTMDWGVFGGQAKVAITFVCQAGRDEWLSLSSASGAVPGTQLFSVTRPDPDPCAGDFEGGSSVAASRRPTSKLVFPPARVKRRPPAKPKR